MFSVCLSVCVLLTAYYEDYQFSSLLRRKLKYTIHAIILLVHNIHDLGFMEMSLRRYTMAVTVQKAICSIKVKVSIIWKEILLEYACQTWFQSYCKGKSWQQTDKQTNRTKTICQYQRCNFCQYCDLWLLKINSSLQKFSRSTLCSRYVSFRSTMIVSDN